MEEIAKATKELIKKSSIRVEEENEDITDSNEITQRD